MKVISIITLALALLLVLGCTDVPTPYGGDDNSVSVIDNNTGINDNNSSGTGVNNLDEFIKSKLGDSVKVHYILSVDGVVEQSSYDSQPLDIVIGKTSLIPGFAIAIVGMKEGEKKTIILSPEEAYGAIEYVDLNTFSNLDGLEVGSVLNNGTSEFKVVSIDGNIVGITNNHALAGKILTFEIEMVKIN